MRAHLQVTVFRASRLDTFWSFVAERQRIWHRRSIEEEERPWTDDDILAEYRFTNVYRELDPGTRYAKHIRRESEGATALYNVLLYRLIGRKETHEAIGLRDPQESKGDLEAALRRRDQRGTVFTAAYTVCAYHWLGGDDKIENVAILFDDLAGDISKTREGLKAAESMKDAYGVLVDLDGIGDFLAYQVLVDLTYDIEGEQFVELDQDEWAKAGPGARRGLEYLGVTSDRLAAMQELHASQDEDLDKRDFPWWRPDGRPQRLKLSDVQNCLCEHSKYEKSRRDEGRPRRTYP